MPVVSFTPRTIAVEEAPSSGSVSMSADSRSLVGATVDWIISVSWPPVRQLSFARFHGVYKLVPVCGAGRGRLLRSISAAFAAALSRAGVGAGLIFTEFRSDLDGGFGGRL